MRVFILDDDPNRHAKFAQFYHKDEVTAVYTADHAIDVLLSSPAFDVVQLDHDLCGKQMVKSGCGTGYEVAYAIAEMAGAKRQGRIIIHSFNADGVLNMMAPLVKKGICVEYRPFGSWIP